MLADKPVGFIFGVGPATQERLAQRGFRLIADLQRADEIELMRQFPTEGRRLWRLARGIDDRLGGGGPRRQDDLQRNDVRERHQAISRRWKNCCGGCRRRSRSRLKSGDLSGLTITLKLKTADFRQRTRSQSIAAPTQLAAKIFAVSREMLAKEIDGTAFRLMGSRRQRADAGLAGRRHRHARPPCRACRARDRRLAQEVRSGRGDPRDRL